MTAPDSADRNAAESSSAPPSAQDSKSPMQSDTATEERSARPQDPKTPQRAAPTPGDSARQQDRPTAVAKKGGWSRSTWYFIVDVLLLLPFLALVWTSAVVKFVFPPGTRAAGYSLWGMSYDRWCDVRFATLAVFSVIVLIHVLIHWAWICNYLASRISRWKGERVTIDDGLKTIYGVGFLIVLLITLGLALAVAAVMVSKPG